MAVWREYFSRLCDGRHGRSLERFADETPQMAFKVRRRKTPPLYSVLTLNFPGLQCAPTCTRTDTCTRYDRHDFMETPIWRRRSRKRFAPSEARTARALRAFRFW